MKKKITIACCTYTGYRIIRGIALVAITKNKEEITEYVTDKAMYLILGGKK